MSSTLIRAAIYELGCKSLRAVLCCGLSLLRLPQWPEVQGRPGRGMRGLLVAKKSYLAIRQIRDPDPKQQFIFLHTPVRTLLVLRQEVEDCNRSVESFGLEFLGTLPKACLRWAASCSKFTCLANLTRKTSCRTIPRTTA